MSIPRSSTRRPVAVAMLFLAVVLLGVISFTRLPIDLLPDVSYPRLVVYTTYADVAPSEVERLVTEPIEARGAAVPGVERVTSTSREGVSLVTLRFAWGTDMDFAMLGVRERLDNIRATLPETAARPAILRVDPEADPVMALSVAGGADLWRTKELAETVFRRRLEQIDGVARAAVTGGLDRQIQVDVDPGLLDSYGISLEDVSAALEAANYSAPGGTILQGRFRYPLRTLGEFQTVEEIGDVVVARQRMGGTAETPGEVAGSGAATASEAGAGQGSGSGLRPDRDEGFRLVRLRDVGRVVDGFAEREAITRYDGAESVGLLVFKESGANTVRVAERVREVLDQLAVEYDEVRVDVASSQAGFISDSIANVVQALVLGGLLAFGVLFFFLRDPRYPVAVALAIPISVVGTFALMEAAGLSLNIMSLGGLALGVGMLVDNSIVVLENIFRHRDEEGKGPDEASAAGAEEVQGAITASTLTTISVFGPIVYVEGVAGELFGDLSLAVAFSLLASLLVALTLLPAMAARVGRGTAPRGRTGTESAEEDVGFGERPGASGRLGRLPPIRFVRELLGFWKETAAGAASWTLGPVLRRFDHAFDAFAERYHIALEWSLDHRARVLGVSAVALVGAAALGLVLDRDLLPDVDQGSFRARLELARGTALDATAGAAGELERALLEEEGVEAVFTRVGRDARALAEGEEAASGLNTAVLDVRLADGVSTDDVLSRVRGMAEGFPPGALTFQTGRATALGRMLGGSDADLAVRIRGRDLEAAFAHAEDLRDRLSGLDRLADVRVGVERGQPQLQVEVRRDVAARHGIAPRRVAEAVERNMRGERATEFVDFDRKIAVMVRLPDSLRHARATLEELRVDGVPLRELIRVRESVGPAEIHREEQGRVVTVQADVASGGLDAAVSAVERVLGQAPPPAGLRVDVGGENEEMRRSFRDLAFAFGLALLLVYMILAAQFESFLHPFTILGSVPLALVGAVMALALTGQGLNTMSLIGVVILVGIVVNDAIVKVDFINQARAAGRPLREAILEAGRVRLRPIVMTTVTTVLGLTPMALGVGRGADLRAPLAIAVIGGLLVATLLTLIVVPVVYDVVEEAGRRVGGRGKAALASASVLVVLVGGGASCSGEVGGGDAGPTVRDSAGVTIVENGSVAAEAALVPEWTIQADDGVRIGTVEGAPTEQLFRVVGAARLSDGRLVVANGGSHELRFYSAAGKFLRAVGGEGEGPGEFTGLAWLGRTPGDTLVTFDEHAFRIVRFGPDGEYLGGNRVEYPTGTHIFRGVVAVAPGGALVGQAGMFADTTFSTGVQEETSLFLLYDRNGKVADTLAVLPGRRSFNKVVGRRQLVSLIPYEAEPQVAFHQERFCVSTGADPEVRCFAGPGRPDQIVRWRATHREVPPSLVDSLVNDWIEDIRTAAGEDAARERASMFREMPIPETMPILDRLVLGDEGNLWVRRYVISGRDTATWLVFDPEGALVGRARVPSIWRLRQIGPDFVLVTWRDELDVEYVGVYPLVKESVS